MAAGASVGAVLLAWAITAVGMLTLVFAFKYLSNMRPDLNAGIYQYAQLGFGNYIGFNMAWGYWLCTAFANVAYAVMLNDSLSVFFPSLINHGWQSAIFGTLLIWSMFFIVANGIHTASIVNTVITFMKFSALFLVIVLIVLAFSASRFQLDFWGQGNASLGGLGTQVRNTMMVTLWCFIGIEGAVMMSARAKRSQDVGRASVIGFFLAWSLYLLVSVLAFGVMTQSQMAELENPSVAYLLRYCCGDWAYYFVIFSIVISLLGGWVAWTLITAQVPYEAAKQKIMPRQFLRLNRHGVPIYGLFLASVIMECFYLCVIMAEKVYLATIEISGMMVLPAYLFCGLFLWKATLNPEKYLHITGGKGIWRYRIVGIACTAYCLWLLYSGGLQLLMLTSIFYMPGLYFYVKSRVQNGIEPKFAAVFSPFGRVCFVVTLVCAIVSLYLLFS